MTHTPGPWEVREKPDGSKVTEHGEDPFTVASNDLLIARIGHQYNASEANARLIAAAPELLEAGREWLSAWSAPNYGTLEYDTRVRRAFNTMKSAIAKAEGRS